LGEGIEHVAAALSGADAMREPWPCWAISGLFPERVLCQLVGLPLSPAGAGAPSGRREDRNETRIYFDARNLVRYPVMRWVGEALQSRAVVACIEQVCRATLAGTFLRIEYALDFDGFWLEPHTDIGVKKLTCFVYLDGDGDLGTDIYADPQTFVRRVPFIANSAIAFVPAHDTWHGFAPRHIAGLRRSLIVNFVGPEWRAREQLCFPDRPVAAPYGSSSYFNPK
jgi:hypothetical protein